MVALTGLTAHHAFEITSFLLYPELGNLSPHPMGIVLYSKRREDGKLPKKRLQDVDVIRRLRRPLLMRWKHYSAILHSKRHGLLPLPSSLPPFASPPPEEEKEKEEGER